MRKLICSGIFLSVAFVLGSAQDATKAEPKHYRLAFENDKVQVVYIHYGAHEKSKEHSHPQGVVVTISDAHLLFTDPDGKTREIFAKAGEARWFPAVRHTVENLGDTDYSGVYIGVKGGPAAAGTAQPQLDEQTAKTLASLLMQAHSPEPQPSK